MSLFDEILPKLKPYVLGWIQDLQQQSTVGAHELSGVLHTGQLADSQAPQFLKLDGTRTLIGNLPVTDGITVDGVDISAHAANVNAHHNQVHILAGSDHSASGLSVGQVLRASGASTFAWAQLAHADLGSVSANQHHNQVHVITGADHTVTGAALDVIGLSAANTLGVLTPSSDVGTTPAAKVLRSTAAGGLILATLTVKGAVDITQDLTVGTNVLLVDVSGNNVGIAGAPDPQFALDVNGPFHADVIYGPLGRLLKDCIFLAHYDGPLDTFNYGGSPQTVQGEMPTVNTGGVIYRPAVYNKGVQVGYATVNKMTNPVYGHTTWNNGWTNGGDLTVAPEYNPTWIYAGTVSAKITRTGAGSARTFYQSINVGNTNTHCLSAYVKKSDGSAPTSSDIVLYYGGLLTTTYAPVGNGWYLLRATVTGVASNTLTGVAIGAMNTPYYLSGFQIEEKGYPTPLAHGSMGQGHSWASTEHASTTTRTVSSLRYNRTMPLADFSIGFWVQPWLAQSENPTTNWAMCWALNADNYLGVIYSTAGLYASWTAAGVRTTVGILAGINRGQKYHVAIVKSGTTLSYYVDGELIGSITPSAMPSLPDILAIGSYYTGGNPISGLIDDFYVLERAQTQDDIKAIIDSEVPVAAEHGATSWYSGGLAPIWVDGEGMWMRDVNGDPVFGWSAVNGKSWGGQTLDMGDNLIGRYGASLGGWQQWDRSAGELALGYSDVKAIRFFSGNAEITGKLQMPGTSSAIAIGATPPTGAAAGTGIWIDRTGLYALNAGAYQVKIDATNGKLYAGGGKITLDSAGIVIDAASASVSIGMIRWMNGVNEAFRIGRYTDLGTPYADISCFDTDLEIYAGDNTTPKSIMFYSGATAAVKISTERDLSIAGGLYVGDFSGNPLPGALYLTDAILTSDTYGAVVGRSAVLSTANNTNTYVAMTTESYDYGWHAASASAIVVPIAGVYLVTANVSFASNTTGIRSIAIQANRTTNLAVQTEDDPQGVTNISVSGLVYLAAGDDIELLAYQNSGGALDLTVYNFGVARIP